MKVDTLYTLQVSINLNKNLIIHILTHEVIDIKGDYLCPRVSNLYINLYKFLEQVGSYTKNRLSPSYEYNTEEHGRHVTCWQEGLTCLVRPASCTMHHFKPFNPTYHLHISSKKQLICLQFYLHLLLVKLTLFLKKQQFHFTFYTKPQKQKQKHIGWVTSIFQF